MRTIHREVSVCHVINKWPCLKAYFGGHEKAPDGRPLTLLEWAKQQNAPIEEVLFVLNGVDDAFETPLDTLFHDVRLLVEELRVKHHAPAKDTLQRIRLLFAKMLEQSLRRPQDAMALKNAFDAFDEAFFTHMLKEEAVVFSCLDELVQRRTPSESHQHVPNSCEIRNLYILCSEHELAITLLKTLGLEFVKFYESQPHTPIFRALQLLLSGLEEALPRHVILEHHALFPKALALVVRVNHP